MSSIPYSRYLIYPVPWYSFLIVTGVVLALVLACRAERRAGLKKDTMIDLALWLLPCGIIGARLYYVAFSWNQFRNDLLSVFRIWEGGIAIYGGIIGGFASLLLFSRRRKISALLLCDLIAPGLALAQGIGRWGNWFNIEAYGFRVSRASLCFFPLAVQVPADGNAWHLASFFFESVWDLAVFLFLMLSRYRKLREKGDVFFFYLFLYAAGRLVIEETRTDSLYMGSSVRASQLLSVLLCFFVFVLYAVRGLKDGSVSPRKLCALMPVFILGIAFPLYWSLSGPVPSGWTASRILLLLSLSSLLLILSLFLVRFFHPPQEVSHADD